MSPIPDLSTMRSSSSEEPLGSVMEKPGRGDELLRLSRHGELFVLRIGSSRYESTHGTRAGICNVCSAVERCPCGAASASGRGCNGMAAAPWQPQTPGRRLGRVMAVLFWAGVSHGFFLFPGCSFGTCIWSKESAWSSRFLRSAFE